MRQPINSEYASSHPSLSLVEMTELLVKHYSLYDGLYDLGVEFQVSIGAVGPGPDKLMLGDVVGISRIGLAKTEIRGPQTVDAAVCNPAKRTRKRNAA